MSDYTRTPNLGLYKPNYALDVGQWGAHLNFNSDTLDSVLGPDRGAVNALDQGADPTGAVDSSDAINAAASQMGPAGHRRAVYLPTGNYRIDKQIRLTGGQALFGDAEGSSYLVISDSFDPTATAVILCTDSVVDPGPTIRDLGLWFIQPTTVTNRATFKTLASGGTSHEGGTGVQYPWAIATAGNSGRIQVRNVVILAAWNGINADAACFWISGLKISAFNIGIAAGGTTAAPVLDFTHVSDVEFWTFGLNTGPLKNVYMDGTTIAMRLGAQNGFVAQNISCFASRLVCTSDALNSGWFSFTNLGMDAWQSTIDVAACAFLQIANLYCTGDTSGLRPIINVASGRVMINNWYATNSSPYPMLSNTGGDVTVVGGYLTPFNGASDTINVAQTGSTRLSNLKIYPATSGAWARPLISQYDTSTLQVDALDVIGVATSGIAVQFNSDQVGNRFGDVRARSGWTAVTGALGPNGNYGSHWLVSYADDVGAAAGGIKIGQDYRNGSIRMVRVT
jgi:hypothetical protein